MIGRGYENRVQIKDIHAQFLQIIQMIQNPLQIAAVKFPDSHFCRIFVPVSHPGHGLPYINIFSVQHIIGRITVGKTIHIYLIEYGSFRPVRGGKTRSDLIIKK